MRDRLVKPDTELAEHADFSPFCCQRCGATVTDDGTCCPACRECGAEYIAFATAGSERRQVVAKFE